MRLLFLGSLVTESRQGEMLRIRQVISSSAATALKFVCHWLFDFAEKEFYCGNPVRLMNS